MLYDFIENDSRKCSFNLVYLECYLMLGLDVAFISNMLVSIMHSTPYLIDVSDESEAR